VRELFFLLVFVLSSALSAQAQGSNPLTLMQTIEIPGVPEGHRTDHLGVDLKGHRLFTTMQEAHEVVVFDLDNGKIIQNIPVANPHAVVYRSDLDKIYVSDDGPGEPGLKIFSGHDYHLIKSVKLLKRTDSMSYDAKTKYLYVVNGGKAANLDYSLISIVDSTTGERVGDIKVSAGTLEDMDLDPSGSRLYIAATDEKRVVVVDPQQRNVIETWSITHGGPVATAVDEAHHLLFVGCRTGQMHGDVVALDTRTGKEITALPIGGLLDYLVFDPQSGRIYAVCSDGYVYVYREVTSDQYVLLGKVETAFFARTGLLVTELSRFFVVSPNTGLRAAELLVFQVQ
jgi:DNA-binding beta-propeller fold protein YncE